MVVLIVDSDPEAGSQLACHLKEFPEVGEVQVFSASLPALEWVLTQKPDAVFLETVFGDASGIRLGEQILEIYPDCSIVFCTAYREYAVEAFALHAVGYLIKPVGEEVLRREWEHLRKDWRFNGKRPLRVQCFGHFEVFYQDCPVKFKFSKTKELFAYLIDRRGAFCDINLLCAVLWENRNDSVRTKSHLRHLIADLVATLERCESGDILWRKRGMLAVLPGRVDCDYYRWLDGDKKSSGVYGGEYMYQYSWAEITTGSLTSYENISEK